MSSPSGIIAPRKAVYAPGARNPEALAQHERNHAEATRVATTAIRSYLRLCVEYTLQFGLHVQALNHAEHRGAGGQGVDLDDVDRMVDRVRASAAMRRPELGRAVERVTEAQLATLIPWCRGQGYLPADSRGNQAGSLPELVVGLAKPYTDDLERILYAYARHLTTPERLNLFAWIYGPSYVRVEVPLVVGGIRTDTLVWRSEPHPVAASWAHAVKASAAVPVSWGASDLRTDTGPFGDSYRDGSMRVGG